MNTILNVSGGACFSASMNVNRFFAAGVRAGYNHNFDGITTLETAALGRWYFLFFEKSRLFAQIELGADLIFYREKTYPAFLGGLGAGWRFHLGPWYAEPSLRLGYPFIWGAGAEFGYRF
jgi:hypothetical protein